MVEAETWIAIGVGVATAAGIIFSIVQGTFSSKNNQKKQVFETLLTLEGELTKIKERETPFASSKENLTDHEQELVYRYASDYLNLLERICFLRKTKYIDEKTLLYFKSELAYGLKLISWKKEKNILPHNSSAYPNILDVTKDKIKKNDDLSNLPQWLELYPAQI